MKIIDLHCDSLYKSATMNIPLNDISMEVKLNSPKDGHKLQCYAIWLPDDISGNEAEELFFRSHALLQSECERLNIKLLNFHDKIDESLNHYNNCAYFTVENGHALNGKPENVKRFAECGVRMMTLTWNASNSIGDGADAVNAKGITKFGKSVVEEMEKNNIIVDISHASPKLFYDVAEIAKRPFIASHSNSYSVTRHRRNLTDGQFQIIKNKGGIVGLNFHNAFLNYHSEKANVYDILRHAERFLSLGGEDTVCFGSDFDGGVLPDDIADSRIYSTIYELFLHENYKESIIKKIFYENALKFFENFDNQRIM